MSMNDTVRDVLTRTRENFLYINATGNYEVTQMVGSYLLAFCIIPDDKPPAFFGYPISQAALHGFPPLESVDSRSLYKPTCIGQWVAQIRHAIAHAHVRFLSEGTGRIEALEFWTDKWRDKEPWYFKISVTDMELVFERFVCLALREAPEKWRTFD